MYAPKRPYASLCSTTFDDVCIFYVQHEFALIALIASVLGFSDECEPLDLKGVCQEYT